MNALVTGVTGLVGYHLADRLVKEGFKVRGLIRESSNASILNALNIELMTGDLCDPISVTQAVESVDYIFHCAALVSDWSSREDMVRINVDGLRELLNIISGRSIKRFVLVSSLVVLGMGVQKYVNESAPYVYTGDNYNFTKIEAEKVALAFFKEKNIPIVIIRPPYIYGAYDRQFLPRIVESLRRGIFMHIDHGLNPISLVYVKNLVEALVLAATVPGAIGQIYHITDGGETTRKELIDIICETMGFESPRRSIPAFAAELAIPLLEKSYQIFNATKPPVLNRFRMRFLHSHLTFDISKARDELGYHPPYSFRDSLQKALLWYLEEEKK